MELIQILTLAIIQGLTEFLPISSSGHLILIPILFGWPDQGLAFDVAVHVGTLIAVVGYFRVELYQLLRDWGRSLGGDHSVSSRLVWGIGVATGLIGVAGLLLEPWVATAARDLRFIATTTLIFGLLLAVADYFGRKHKDLSQLTWPAIGLIGGAQMLALLPGTSRAGITITAALLLGFSRAAAARFAFFLAIPIIGLAGFWQAIHLTQASNPPWSALLLATGTAAIVAFISIHFFLRYLQNHSLMPFALYRLVLGLILLAWF